MKLTKFATALLIAGMGVSFAASAKITVFAAASMTDALQQIAEKYKAEKASNEVVFSFASSSTLAKQVEEGAPADLFISASNKWMKYLSDKNLTVKETEKVLVGNELVLIAPAKSTVNSVDVAKGEWIKGLKDSYLSVGDPAHVPAGQYAEESLTTYAERLLQLYDLLEQTQEHAFHILQDETIPLNSLLSATAKFSLQSSARNQFFGKVASQHIVDSRCIVAVNIQDLAHPLHVSITLRSAERLKLITEKEVMVMFKAPWVKVSATTLEEKNNLFQATILSMQNEEAILQIKDSSIEFCASIHSKDGWKVGQEVWLHVEPEQIILATLK